MTVVEAQNFARDGNSTVSHGMSAKIREGHQAKHEKNVETDDISICYSDAILLERSVTVGHECCGRTTYSTQEQTHEHGTPSAVTLHAIPRRKIPRYISNARHEERDVGFHG